VKVPTWVWELAQDYPGADNDDTHLPISEVVIKTHEQTRWFTTKRIAQLAGIYRDQGITLSAWCVPTGLVDDAGLAIAVLKDLRAAGIEQPWLQFDVEVEPGKFWQGRPVQLLGIFANIRLACPWARLALCVYQWDNALYGIDDLAPLADRLVSMSYWTDFDTTPEAQLASDYRHLSFYKRPVQLGLPGNVSKANLKLALDWIRANTPADIPPIIWRRGTTSRAVWDAIAAYDWPAPKPEPEPTMEGVKLGLVRKVLDEQWAPLRDDATKLAGQVKP
jgi:hypothetical protein